MDEARLIAKQQLEIETLKEKVAELEDSQRSALQYFYCIGGPLNDNVLGFNVEQRRLLHKIAEVLN
jgi:hypothetical protein